MSKELIAAARQTLGRNQPFVLLPCPFCGSTELNGPHISEYDRHSSWWVDCEECPGGMEVKGEDVQGLVAAWNKRAEIAYRV